MAEVPKLRGPKDRDYLRLVLMLSELTNLQKLGDLDE